MSDRLKNVTSCIDMDQWKHSWHNPLKTVDELRGAREVISEKIDQTIERLTRLQSGLADVNILIEENITGDVDQMQRDIRHLLEGTDKDVIDQIKEEYA